MVCHNFTNKTTHPKPSNGKIKKEILMMIKYLIKWFESMANQWEFIFDRQVDFDVYQNNPQMGTGGVHFNRLLNQELGYTRSKEQMRDCGKWPEFQQMWYDAVTKYNQFKYIHAELPDEPSNQELLYLEHEVRGVYNWMSDHHKTFYRLGEMINNCINRELNLETPKEYDPDEPKNDFTGCDDNKLHKNKHVKKWLSEGVLWDDPLKKKWGSPQIYCNVPSPLKHLGGKTLQRFLNNVLPKDLVGFGTRDMRAFVDGLQLNAGFSVSHLAVVHRLIIVVPLTCNAGFRSPKLTVELCTSVGMVKTLLRTPME